MSVEGRLSSLGVPLGVSASFILVGLGLAFKVDEAVARVYDGGAITGNEIPL